MKQLKILGVALAVLTGWVGLSIAAGPVTQGGPRLYGVSSSSGSSSGGLGNVVAYSALNVTSAGIQTLDTSQTTPIWNANCTSDSAWGVGGRFGWRCQAPASGSNYSGIGQLSLKNGGGSATIQRLWVRWYIQVSAAWSANNTFDAVKHAIFWSGAGPVRPMIYIDSRPGDGSIGPSGTSTIQPAQGTTRYRSEVYQGSTVDDGANRYDAYFGAGAATTVTNPSNSQVKQVLAASEWVCVELLLDDTHVNGNANGLIRMRLTRANNTILSDLDASMPWDYEGGVAFDGDIGTIDVIGGYYNDFATNPGSTNYIAIDRYISFEMNPTGFNGCEAAFLTGDARAMPAANDDIFERRLAA